MNYTSEYKKFIQSEVRTSKQSIAPMNLYRISTYKTVDGKLKSQPDDKSSIIFVTGLHPTPQKDKLINCLKVSEIPPLKFMGWLKKIVDKNVKLEEVVRLSDLLIKTEPTGKRLFEQYVKPSNVVYNLKESIYRTYNVTGILYIQEIFLTQDTITDILLK